MLELEVGTLVAERYRIVSILGKGAMGIVYRAEQLDAELRPLREVALKMILPDQSLDEEFSKRFLRETRVAANLDTPNSVTVFDAGRTDDGQLFYTMELVKGRPLSEVLEDGALPVERAVEIALQMFEALSEAHEGTDPIIHRDLKPANVFITEKGGRDRVKVADFGMAKVMRSDATALTETGVSIGTPLYMSPEQLLARKIDKRCDIYAVGVVLYEMVAGRHPFRDPNKTVAATLNAILNSPPPPLPETVPPAVRGAILRIMAAKVDTRPANADAASALLAAAVRGEEPAPPTAEHAAGGKSWMLVAIVAIVVALGAVGMLALR